MESIYRVEGATAETSAFAGGPWDPKLQHGAAPSSLICWAVERLPASAPMRVARLTVDLMRPVPVAPLTIETELLREGRKIQLVAVRLLANGTEVVRATVLRVRRLGGRPEPHRPDGQPPVGRLHQDRHQAFLGLARLAVGWFLAGRLHRRTAPGARGPGHAGGRCRHARRRPRRKTSPRAGSRAASR